MVTQTEEFSLEALEELPDDPVELVTLYKRIKPQYEEARLIVDSLTATLNALADRVAEVTDGEIQLKYVGGANGDVKKSRIAQAARMAAELADDDGPVLPKAQPQRRRSAPGPLGTRDLYPGLHLDPEQAWQAQTDTPREAIAASGAYVPQQVQISGSDAQTAQRMDPAVAQIRADGRADAEIGLQNRINGIFQNVGAQALANSPVVAAVPR